MGKYKDESNKGGISPMAAGLTGLAVGVAAGVVATTLTDKDKREKAKKKVDEVSEQAKKAYDSASEQAGKAWDTHGPKIKNALKRKLDRTETAAEKAKRAAREAAEDIEVEVSDMQDRS